VATLSSLDIALIAFVVVLAVIVVGLLVYLLKRLRARAAQLRGELENTPVLSQDRAFNRIAMARRETSVLVGQRVDVHRAQEIIAEAQGAFDIRQYDRAYQLAQSAHESLVNARAQGSRVVGAPLPSKGSEPKPVTTPIAGSAPSSTSPAAESTPRPTIPKNRAESQFQLHLLRDELTALSPSAAQDPKAIEAASIGDQASAAFDREEYTEAFRLALHARRALGDVIESLPPPGTSSAAAPVKGAANGSATGPDAARTAETVADAERCAECGYPMLANDPFCRGCGRPRGPLTCPTCGATRGADEPFCGQCGNRFP